jgi:DNA-3-methyladenine glycosylase
VGAALALDPSWSHHDLCAPGGLEVHGGDPVEQHLVGPRVGIDYAEPEHRDALWRFAVAGTRWVTRPSALTPG